MVEEFGRPYTNNRMYKTLPLNSTVQLWRDFSTIPFELVFIEKGVYDMGPDFINGVDEAGEIGGLPSWSLLLRRK